MPILTNLRQHQKTYGKYLTLPIVLAFILATLALSGRAVLQAQTLTSAAIWQAHNSDLLYIASYSQEEQPYGPLVVYRAAGGNLRDVMPVVAVQRGPSPQTPILFPSPDGRYLALLNPLMTGYASNLSGASLSILSTSGRALAPLSGRLSLSGTTGVPAGARILALHVASADQVIWSADSRYLYYHTATSGQEPSTNHASRARQPLISSGYDEIHRVDLAGHDMTLYRRPADESSLRLVGLDRSGGLILTLARPALPVELLRMPTSASVMVGTRFIASIMTLVMTLPSDILPGNVLRVGSDGESIECERVTSWQPLRYTTIRLVFANGSITRAQPLFDTGRYGHALSPLARSADGAALAMSQVVSTRGDLAAQGIENVPAQEKLLLADARTGAMQSLTLPYGGQIVQAFWTSHIAPVQVRPVPQDTLARLLPLRKRVTTGPSQNASVLQQDEWMLEGHNGKLLDAPALPSMCYGLCTAANGAPHVSAAILHGVAYTESNWHQFNSSDYQVDGEGVGTPVESFDGGWGQYQQTWGMPPQCIAANNCRSDVNKVQYDQSYNIGVGIASLINAWNNSAGVASSTDPNDPYKANDWFFSVWAYNGSYGNNPNDVPSSQYAQWYPGAPFHAIYEEYVWYFAAHPQFFSNGWTDNYVPSLGPALLPPQNDFSKTSDSFVVCVTCTIPDWTTGSYDREWVGSGAPDNQVASAFTTAFAQLGGESGLGLPRDNGGGALAHRWGNGWIQDFGGGSDLPGALMLADGTTTPYWVHGGVWMQYLGVDHGVTGCHGYPTSNLVPFSDPGQGSDTHLRQAFQQGYIEWDATTGTIVTDVC
ncbi:MAG TPA: hypothetical protein VKR83_16205 [Ktedonobacteraceae bacterium]|nr:hypothetical protein [Ktedonobacteraceae bacterium]